jgi:hypothetical protein
MFPSCGENVGEYLLRWVGQKDWTAFSAENGNITHFQKYSVQNTRWWIKMYILQAGSSASPAVLFVTPFSIGIHCCNLLISCSGLPLVIAQLLVQKGTKHKTV